MQNFFGDNIMQSFSRQKAGYKTFCSVSRRQHLELPEHRSLPSGWNPDYSHTDYTFFCAINLQNRIDLVVV